MPPLFEALIDQINERHTREEAEAAWHAQAKVSRPTAAKDRRSKPTKRRKQP